MFAGPVPSFFARVFTNGRVTPSRSRCGHEAITSNFAAGAKDTMRRYELSVSNGFAFYFGVGKTELVTLKTNILPRSPGVVLLGLSSMSPLPGKANEHFVDTKCGKAVEVDQKSLKISLTALLRCLVTLITSLDTLSGQIACGRQLITMSWRPSNWIIARVASSGFGSARFLGVAICGRTVKIKSVKNLIAFLPETAVFGRRTALMLLAGTHHRCLESANRKLSVN